jgi:8-oxo-dGTP pyrophosphatase MutT (NUDIX family)
MPTPDFILELRAMVGHHPLWLPGVTALVVDEQGRVLMVQRSDNGLWTLPSGIAEPGEEMAASCAREVLEETGIVVQVEELISIRTVGPVTYPNNDVTSYVDHFFRCRPISGTAQVGDDESIAVGWFAPDALPEPGTPRTSAQLSEALEQAVTGRTRFRP